MLIFRGALKQIGEDIWIVDGPVVQMLLYGLRVPFPTRMTIVRLGNGDLWCHSPTAFSPALKEQVDSLGPVRHLISPNKIHYVHIGAWLKTYPGAIAWASPGVRERVIKQKMDVAFSADLRDAPPPEWDQDLDQMIFAGNLYLDEVVFFHRKSSTLILTDLIENFEVSRLNKVSWQYGFLLRVGGCVEPDGQAPLDLRLAFCPRKQDARRSFRRLLDWNPEQLVFAHGRWCDRNGAEQLRRSFRWLQ
ncbi:DUF4336 domain-containing protein [Synechococcus sp. CBW1107]|uniref:DUF4336 domain-containing protein n=1 Tax=Synechococcus sp. CBW1107 TaxID=2789857 RepID=UPI002AD44170|nr:DUF4336 domain-containing protein [Synechococcus sp. CBW1107]